MRVQSLGGCWQGDWASTYLPITLLGTIRSRHCLIASEQISS
jgi:hypothetical protein